MTFLPQETNLQDVTLLLSQQFTCKGPLSQGHCATAAAAAELLDLLYSSLVSSLSFFDTL